MPSPQGGSLGSRDGRGPLCLQSDLPAISTPTPSPPTLSPLHPACTQCYRPSTVRATSCPSDSVPGAVSVLPQAGTDPVRHLGRTAPPPGSRRRPFGLARPLSCMIPWHLCEHLPWHCPSQTSVEVGGGVGPWAGQRWPLLAHGYSMLLREVINR